MVYLPTFTIKTPAKYRCIYQSHGSYGKQHNVSAVLLCHLQCTQTDPLLEHWWHVRIPEDANIRDLVQPPEALREIQIYIYIYMYTFRIYQVGKGLIANKSNYTKKSR